MAVLFTLLSIGIGVGVGLAAGGSVDRLLSYRPHRWQALAGGLAIQLLIRLVGIDGSWAVVLELVSAAALLTFAVTNVRVGGMVLVVAGLALNLVPTVIDWGIPTSRDALVSAGIIERSAAGEVELSGPRHVATDADSLRWLGEVIPLPTRQVVSFGDLLLHAGYALVIAALLRGRILPDRRQVTYGRRLAPLGDGPARRRGPGLHPSRLDPRTARSGPQRPGQRPGPRRPGSDDDRAG